MQMHQVRYFLTLCDEQNFTRAAKRCGVSQPSLTRAIKLLEEELGSSLYDRANNRMTDFGIIVRSDLALIDRSAAEIKRKAAKRLAARSTTQQRRAIDEGAPLMEEHIPAKNADVRRKKAMSADYDFKNVMVVASVWLFLYAVMLADVFSNEHREGLASIATLVSPK